MHLGQEGVNGTHPQLGHAQLFLSEHVVSLVFLLEVSLTGQSYDNCRRGCPRCTHCTFGKFNSIASLIEKFFCNAIDEWRVVVPNPLPQSFNVCFLCNVCAASCCDLANFLTKSIDIRPFLFRRVAMSFPLLSLNFQLWTRLLQ